MSSRVPSRDPVDLDLLADYTAGVLAPDEAARVEALIRADDRWERALAALVPADEAVRAELRDLAASRPAQMPADVVGRVDRALRAAGTGASSPAAGASVTSLADARAKRGLRRRFLTGAAAAAASLVLVLCGITVVRGGLTQMDSGSTAGGAPQQAENDGATVEAPSPAIAPDAMAGRTPVVVSTGTDYTRQNLASGLPPGVVPQFSSDGRGGSEALPEPTVPPPVAKSVPEPMRRLTERTALSACLLAIRQRYPGVPTLVDYARYEGRPALIVTIRSGPTTTVVAVGAACGVAGPDEMASATRS